MNFSSPSKPAPPRLALPLIAAAILAAAAGCRQPLLSPDAERSQYDRYDTVRSQRAPQQVIDEFGRGRPNLRGRLLPKD